MPNDDKLTFLEQLSNALVGQTVTGGARALGEGIGYGVGGGALSDIPDVMREALERHKAKSANQTKNEQDALAVASGLAAMSNPISAVGHGIDFAAAVPEMLEYKLSDAEPPTGMIAETGLKRRLQKGGAAADYAMKNQLERAQQNLKNRHLLKYEPEGFFPLYSKGAKWGPGEGKFQAVEDFGTSAYDLSRKPDHRSLVGMGQKGDDRIISGSPHDLGVEFENTHGLAPEYRGKGYGKQIYQNMADVYGGGISHEGNTTGAARKVYERLGAIDTGIPSGGGTRQALPTREMKADPSKMADFEQRVEEYAGTTPAGRAAQKDYLNELEALESLRPNQGEFIARELLRNQIGDNQVKAGQITKVINERHRIYLQDDELPNVINFGRYQARRIRGTDLYQIE